MLFVNAEAAVLAGFLFRPPRAENVSPSPERGQAVRVCSPPLFLCLSLP